MEWRKGKGKAYTSTRQTVEYFPSIGVLVHLYGTDGHLAIEMSPIEARQLAERLNLAIADVIIPR